MMHWLNDLIWLMLRALATALQLAGFAGILLLALLAVWGFAGWLES